MCTWEDKFHDLQKDVVQFQAFGRNSAGKRRIRSYDLPAAVSSAGPSSQRLDFNLRRDPAANGRNPPFNPAPDGGIDRLLDAYSWSFPMNNSAFLLLDGKSMYIKPLFEGDETDKRSLTLYISPPGDELHPDISATFCMNTGRFCFLSGQSVDSTSDYDSWTWAVIQVLDFV